MQTFELKYSWDTRDRLTSFQGPLFHGVLMNGLDQDYAQKIHQSNLSEFHMKIRPLGNQQMLWTLEALTDEAAMYIEEFVSLRSEQVHIKKRGLDLHRIDQEIHHRVTYTQWLNGVLRQHTPDYLLVGFHSPTSFKRQGDYLNEPSTHYIYMNLIRRLNQLQDTMTFGANYHQELGNLSQIVFQDTEDLNFPVGRFRVPAFRGKILLQLTGTPEEKTHQYILWKFAERAGVGIKTAQGMGYITIQELNKER